MEGRPYFIIGIQFNDWLKCGYASFVLPAYKKGILKRIVNAEFEVDTCRFVL